MIRHFLGLCEDNHTHLDLIDCIAAFAVIAIIYKLIKQIKWSTQTQNYINQSHL